jgi:hypothetical protein
LPTTATSEPPRRRALAQFFAEPKLDAKPHEYVRSPGANPMTASSRRSAEREPDVTAEHHPTIHRA